MGKWLFIALTVVTLGIGVYLFLPGSGSSSTPTANSHVAPLNAKEVFIWPGTAPGSENVVIEEVVSDSSTNPAQPSRNITGIKRPSLIPFTPEKPNGAAVIVMPGGGYTKLVYDKEGTDIAKWLVSFGVTAFVLKYRLPGEGHADGDYVPLQDAQRALRFVRKNAASWGVNPDKVGIMGFSAGGHLAASLGVYWKEEIYKPTDDIDKIKARPDFMVLAYPGLRGELPVNPETPPTFIVVGGADVKVDPARAAAFYEELQNVSVPGELHIFTRATHGFAIRNAKGPVAGWTRLCRDWLREMGIITK